MHTIKIDTQTGIMYRKWGNPSSSKAVFLLIHGLGAQSERWEFLSQFLLNNKFSAYAIEFRGYGETKETKGHIDSFNVYYKDIETLYNIIKQELPDKKIFILGESMGALISFLLSIKKPDLFNGIICISPAFVNTMKFPVIIYLKFIVSLFFAPKTLFQIPFSSQSITRDVEYQKKLDDDKRELRVASAKTLFEILAAQLKCAVFKNKIGIPLLFLVAGIDKLVDVEASKNIFEKIKISDKKIISYPEMYHALSIDLGRESVFQDILNWVNKHL